MNGGNEMNNTCFEYFKNETRGNKDLKTVHSHTSPPFAKRRSAGVELQFGVFFNE